MRHQITVLLNEGEGRFWEYNPDTCSLHEALTFEVETVDVDDALERTWAMCNSYPSEMFVHGATDDDIYVVTRYRHRRNRSLSAGDVVLVNERAFAVERIGWRELPTPVHFTATGEDDPRLGDQTPSAAALAARSREASEARKQV